MSMLNGSGWIRWMWHDGKPEVGSRDLEFTWRPQPFRVYRAHRVVVHRRVEIRSPANPIGSGVSHRPRWGS